MDGMSDNDVVTPSADLVKERLAAAISIKQQMAAGSYAEKAVDVARAMITALRSGRKVIFFGNGGSAQDAGHLSAELMGRFAFDPQEACMHLGHVICEMVEAALFPRQ